MAADKPAGKTSPPKTWEQPPDWSYSAASLMQVPDGKRIEEHAKEIISRALVQGRTVAFVGAGAPMAYGRLSWRDLVLSLQDKVLDDAREHLGGGRPDPGGQISRARQLLERHRPRVGDQTDSSLFPLLFQLMERLDQLLAPWADGTRHDFRKMVQRALRDDRGHMEYMLRSVVREQKEAQAAFGGAQPQEDWLKAFHKRPFGLERRDSPEMDAATQDPRKRIYLKKLIGRARSSVGRVRFALAGASATALLAALERFANRASTGSDAGWLPPYHRFTVGVALRLARGWGGGVSQTPEAYWPPAEIRREQLIPVERDPMLLLLRLGINRFLTTNYDQEIEKLLADEGAAPDDELLARQDDAKAVGLVRGNPAPPSLRQIVFDRSKTGELLAFAARGRRRGAEVVHLHGLAAKGQKLVATEADYAAHYLSDNVHRSLMDDAVAAAFAGSPLLFVGSGFSEDDLLRPLRHFLGDNPRPMERRAVALLPALKKNSPAEMERIRILQRYGVHVIHFGHTMIEGDKECWLAEANAYQEALTKQLQALVRALIAQPRDEAIQKFIDASRRLERELNEARALATVPTVIEGESIAEVKALDIGKEVKLLDLAADFLKSATDALAAGRAASGQDMPNLLLLARAHLASIQGAFDSITGAFLCARLLRLAKDRDAWNLRWLRPLVHARSVNYVKAWSEGAEFRPRRLACKARDDGEPEEHELLPAMRIHRRHPTVNPAMPNDTSDPRGRFFADAPSQAYSSFLSALHNSTTRRHIATPPPGRRIFMILGQRGGGKGNFFGSLQSPTRLGPVLEAIGAGTSDKDAKARWEGACFLNLSFSHEVGSAFDTLVRWLDGCRNALVEQKQLPADVLEHLESAGRDFVQLENDRLARLRQMLGAFGKAAHMPGGLKRGSTPLRWVIAINSLHLLLDAAGEPVNAQFQSLLDAILGDGAKDVPIDVFIVTAQDTPPARLRQGSTALNIELRRGLVTARESERLDHYGRFLSLQALDKARGTTRVPWAYVHFLRRPRAAVLVCAFFPSVALAIGHVRLDRLAEHGSDDCRSLAEALDEVRLSRTPSDGGGRDRRVLRQRLQPHAGQGKQGCDW